MQYDDNKIGNGNLKPFNELTVEEQRKLASKGGKASGNARRKKKQMRETIELLLSLPEKNDDVKLLLERMGIKNPSKQDVMMYSMWKTAVQGNVQAATFLRDTIGQKPKDEMNIEGNLPVVISGEDKLED